MLPRRESFPGTDNTLSSPPPHKAESPRGIGKGGGGLATVAEPSSLLPSRPEMAKILRPGFSTHTPTVPKARRAGPSCDVENSMSERPPQRSGSS